MTDNFILYYDRPHKNSRHYVHPGCAKWFAPLDGRPPPEPGSDCECAECAMVLTLVHEEDVMGL